MTTNKCLYLNIAIQKPSCKVYLEGIKLCDDFSVYHKLTVDNNVMSFQNPDLKAVVLWS